MVWKGFFLVNVLIFVIGLILFANGDPNRFVGTPKFIFISILFIIGVTACPFSESFFNRLFRESKSKMTSIELFNGIYWKAFIIKTALIDSNAIFGFVIYQTTADLKYFILFSILSIIYKIKHKPKYDHFIAHYELLRNEGVLP